VDGAKVIKSPNKIHEEEGNFCARKGAKSERKKKARPLVH
jgi:hypothetical protein